MKSKMGENLKREESEVETNIGGKEVIGMVTGGLVEGGKTAMTGEIEVTEEDMASACTDSDLAFALWLSRECDCKWLYVW